MPMPGPYRLRRGQDPVWPPDRAYGGAGRAGEQRRKLEALGLAAARLIVPVALLMVLLGATYLYADDLFSGLPVPIRSAGLAVSDLILPGAWYLHSSHQPALWPRLCLCPAAGGPAVAACDPDQSRRHRRLDDSSPP